MEQNNRFAINILTDKVIKKNNINYSEATKEHIRLGRPSKYNKVHYLSSFFHKSNFKLEKIVTFFDVADGHQWQKKDKKRKLLSIINNSGDRDANKKE